MKKFYRGWKALHSHTSLGYDPATDRVVCSDDAWQSFVQVFKECNHLHYEGLRNKELYYNVFEKNRAVGASGFGSVTVGGGSTLSFDFDFYMDQSGTQPVLEEEMSPSINGRRQGNTRGGPEEAGPSRSTGSAGKWKQRDATDEMTFSAMQEITNHFRGRSQSATSSDQSSQKDHILECMNTIKEMGIPQIQRTIMWHYFDAHPRLQRPFYQHDDDDQRGIIDSIVNPQPPPAN
ncbi:hypothetical protein TIFTF001_040399 [Ficus carica]|uniref:Myb/SANT-like domain-containing protein n=1 Tax=Ficus carica TaxID=3494 RepID=A0AA87YVM3_FICCA|nr:hypothetical protein TIFTF001_040399 [Ficus carica]